MAGTYDIYDRWIRDIPQQFHGKKNIDVLIRAFSRQLDEINKVFDDLNHLTDLETAYGENLDMIGDIIPLSRKEAAEIDPRTTSVADMTDERYRQFLKWKLLSNTSECTYWELMEGIALLWKLETVHYEERLEYPATIVFAGEFDLDKPEVFEFYPDLLIRGSGVGALLEKQYVTSYEVDIQYENRITLQTEFYPRYNLGFLALDGTWILDGSRRLNGYNSGSIIDFYPVSVRIPMEVSPQLKAGLQSRIQAECMIATDGNSDIEVVVDTEVDESADIDRILIRAEVSAGIDYSAGVTRMNLLDGTWKLDGSRKLDGGREILSGIPDDGQFIPGRLVVVSRSITVSDGTLVSDETLYAELEDDGLRIYYNDDTEMKLEVIPIEK